MLDPMQRWREYGEKPDYAGPLTFGGVPCTQDAAELAGFDVAIVGAPMDELVSDRPGARFAPRAIRAASCPPGPHLEAGVDAFARVADRRLRRRARRPRPAGAQPRRDRGDRARRSSSAGLLPVIIGGDHSITAPNARACAARHGPLGLVHFDTHTDTGEEVFGATLSHGTVMRTIVDEGVIDPRRYVQIGLRGYWPGPAEFAWQAERGIASLFMHDVRDRGIRDVDRTTRSTSSARARCS